MGVFIPGDNFDRPGGAGEKIVFEKIKESFAEREILVYSRYPLFMECGQRRKEPDIVLVDEELGIIVIEVKSYRVNSILNLEPNEWTLIDSYDRRVNPLGQVEDYVYSICGKMDINRNIRNNYKIKGVIALPYITEREFREKGFLDKIDSEVILFKDDLTKMKMLEKLKTNNYLKNGNGYNRKIFEDIQSILGHGSNLVEEVEKIFNFESGTKKDIINKLKREITKIDYKQEQIGKSIAPGPQRIRGIAGSGKTLLICQKAVYMFLKNPEQKIVITFFTQSLYETIRKTVDMYLRVFTQGKERYRENSNLKIMHAWGSVKLPGLYREISRENNLTFLAAGDLKAWFKGYVPPEVSINFISQYLLKEAKGKLKESYDAIFIDEGQDLVGDDKYKFEGKQPFYYMAYLSLKGEKKLVWAYDELQSLNDTKIPSAKELFGDSKIVQGMYKGGIKKSEVMKTCYRTPYEVLTTAHAIGMGFFRKDGLVSGYTTKKDWENIGYVVEKGDFRKANSEVVLVREEKNNTNIIKKYYKEKLVNFKRYDNQGILVEDMGKMIRNDVRFGNLDKSKDILVINLKQGFKSGEEVTKSICEELRKQNLNYYIPTLGSKNKLIEVNYRFKKMDKFWEEDAITVSNIERAKGNEAYMVYILGVEDIAKDDGNVALRNKLFTAITRTKAWVTILGVGKYSLYEEIEKAIESNGRFKFIYNKPKKESNDFEVGEN